MLGNRLDIPTPHPLFNGELEGLPAVAAPHPGSGWEAESPCATHGPLVGTPPCARLSMTPEEHRAFWRDVQFTVDKDVVRTDRSNQFFRGEGNPNVESMRYPLASGTLAGPPALPDVAGVCVLDSCPHSRSAGSLASCANVHQHPTPTPPVSHGSLGFSRGCQHSPHPPGIHQACPGLAHMNCG